MSDLKVDETSRLNSMAGEPEAYVALSSMQEYNPITNNPYENIDRSLIDNLVDENPDQEPESPAQKAPVPKAKDDNSSLEKPLGEEVIKEKLRIKTPKKPELQSRTSSRLQSP